MLNHGNESSYEPYQLKGTFSTIRSVKKTTNDSIGKTVAANFLKRITESSPKFHSFELFTPIARRREKMETTTATEKRDDSMEGKKTKAREEQQQQQQQQQQQKRILTIATVAE